MQSGNNRFVIGRENNVVQVDFSRDPDPPAPRFPGATGLREIDNESATDGVYFSVALGPTTATGAIRR
jgi:hypothetical protein